MEDPIMGRLKLKLLAVCIVAGLFAVTAVSVQTAEAARWNFHFTYGQCPGGDLAVWATINCVPRLNLFSGYAKQCKTYSGFVPGPPYNDVIFVFEWDYWCGNVDYIKIALPGWNDKTGLWELKELPPWINANVQEDLVLPSLGDPTGQIQNVYIVVDLQTYLEQHDPFLIDSFFDVFAELSVDGGSVGDLPGYLIGTTPITFDPHAPPPSEGGYPFSTTPLVGTLPVDGQIILTAEEPITFEQLDVLGPWEPTINSSWGRVTVELSEPPGFHYFNLNVDGRWVVRNRSLESSGEPQTLMTMFDLGVYHGTNVPSLEYSYSIDEEPQQTMLPGAAAQATVEDVDYQIGGESDVTLGDLPYIAEGPFSLCLVKNSGQLPNLGSFVNQPQGTNQCAPGAISNSLKYLQATGGVDPTADTSIGTVGGQIGTTGNGTASSWYEKKKELPYFTNLVTTRYIEAPLDAAKIQDLINELNRGQDIEMDLKGHVEVLAGIRVMCDGTIELDLFDDNQTDNQSDPMHTSPLIGYPGTGTQYVDSMELERFVIECPKEDVHVCIPYFRLDTYEEWAMALAEGAIEAVSPEEWSDYMAQWRDFHEDEEPYPENTFSPATLYVYGGGGGGGAEPCDAGLVMEWNTQGHTGPRASAYEYVFPEDPDLSNCTITVVVTAPQFDLNGNQINQVSLGLKNPPQVGGPIRSWYWNCGLGQPIPWNVPTKITIDTSKTGVTAAKPTATSYMNNPGFSLLNVQWLVLDENGTWVGGTGQIPSPGGITGLWNYWHWLMISPNTTVDKGIFKKWSQPPIVLDANDPPLFLGWDEPSDYHMPVVADDWKCKDDRPITDIHWWGSHLGWTQPHPPALPRAFHIGIWTDMPASAAGGTDDFSHPDLLVWENYCDNYVWNFAGYDRDPRKYGDKFPGGDPAGHDDPGIEPSDACFQYTQLLSQDEWFYQKPSDDPDNPRIYWLSIAPIWGDETLQYQWGWKTRRHYFQDDAVSMQLTTQWPPVVGLTKWVQGIPIQYPPYPNPDSITFDMAFELTTNEPDPNAKPNADLYPDGVINFKDLAIMVNLWGTVVTTTP